MIIIYLYPIEFGEDVFCDYIDHAPDLHTGSAQGEIN